MTASAHTTLCEAIQAYDIDSARKLLENGADPNEKTNIGTPAILFAVCRSRELLELLLDHDADINATNEMGTTALMSCIILGKSNPVINSMTQYLIDKGADLEKTDIGGRTAIDWANTVGNLHAENLIRKAISDRKTEARLKIEAEQKKISDIQETIAARQAILNKPHTKVKIIRRNAP